MCHADEVYLQFYPLNTINTTNYPLTNITRTLNTADEEVSNALLGLWKSFIKYGIASTKGKLIAFYQLVVDMGGISTVCFYNYS